MLTVYDKGKTRIITSNLRRLNVKKNYKDNITMTSIFESESFI